MKVQVEELGAVVDSVSSVLQEQSTFLLSTDNMLEKGSNTFMHLQYERSVPQR